MIKWHILSDDDHPPKFENVIAILPDGEEVWTHWDGYDWIRPGTSTSVESPVFWKPLGE